MHHSDCLSQATFTFLVCVYQSRVECDPASQFVCADQAKCVDVRFCCEGNHLCRGLRGENGNITSKTASAVLCETGIVECLKGWRCMVEGVEGWGSVVGGVEVCGRAGGVWWDWRCVGGVEECGGKGKLCGERGKCE